MKKALSIFSILFLLSSCTMKEKMVINEDGSGQFSYGFDMSEIMKMGNAKPDSTKPNKIIDTSFVFKDILEKMPDSVKYNFTAVQKEQFKAIENFKVNLKVNDEQKVCYYNLVMDFKSVGEMQNMTSPTKTAEYLAKSDKRAGGASSNIKPKDSSDFRSSFFYDGKTFVKKIFDKNNKEVKGKLVSKKTKPKKEVIADDVFSKKMSEMMKQCKYSMEYSFPKKIKAISLKGAIISQDRKSFLLEVPVAEMDKNSDKLGFQIIFE